MFTTFKTLKIPQKEACSTQDPEAFMLLQQALHNSLNENTDRIYIQDTPYLLEFKSNAKLDLLALKKMLENNQLKILENKVVGGEIFVHVFQTLPHLHQFEVWYRPQSRPRI